VSHQCFFSLLVKYGEVAAIVVLLVLVFCRRTEEESIPSLLSLSLSHKRNITFFSGLIKEREIYREKKREREKKIWNRERRVRV
jgi:hypothetical protein